MIPKVIYYCWFGRKEKPDKVKENIKTWKELNPGYIIVEINEKNFKWREYPFTKEAYRENMWAFVSDMAKIEFLYKYGGFGLDTDVELLMPLDKFLKYKSIWAMESPGVIAPGLIIGAKPHDRDLENIYKLYRSIRFVKEDAEKDLKSPTIVTNYFNLYGLKAKNDTQILDNGQLILSSDYFAPFHWWGGGKITSNTMGIHCYSNSWGANLNISRRKRFMKNWNFYFPSSYILAKKFFNIVKR